MRIEVADTGRDIDEADRERLFQPFYTTKPTGMGMGLVIARSIVEAHGGSLSVASHPGRGADLPGDVSHDRRLEVALRAKSHPRRGRAADLLRAGAGDAAVDVDFEHRATWRPPSPSHAGRPASGHPSSPHQARASACVQAPARPALLDLREAARPRPPAGPPDASTGSSGSAASRKGSTGAPSFSEGGRGIEWRWCPMMSTPDFPVNTGWPAISA